MARMHALVVAAVAACADPPPPVDKAEVRQLVADAAERMAREDAEALEQAKAQQAAAAAAPQPRDDPTPVHVPKAHRPKHGPRPAKAVKSPTSADLFREAESREPPRSCCKHCGASSQPCGNSCISLSKTCRKGRGCAC